MIQNPVEIHSRVQTITQGTPKVVYTKALEPVVTSVRQISHPESENVTSVTQKIVNEEVIENREKVLESEIRRLRNSIKTSSQNEKDITLYQ